MRILLKLLVVFALAAVAVPASATTVQEVTSPGGIKAWLVQDDKLPLIAMSFSFRGGVEQDPADKQGLASLTMSMLDEGAGNYDAAGFQQELADHSISLHFSAGRDALGGGLKCLKSEQDKAFELLKAALTQPRFNPADVERIRDSTFTALKMQLANPGWQGRYLLFQTVFANHPYSERKLGSLKTLKAITREDMTGFMAQHLAKANLLIAVAGDITAEELGKNLDTVFGGLPAKATLQTIPEVVWPSTSAILLAKREGTQTELTFAMPGPKRDNPDWYAAQIANYIIGGGSFQSRLMQDVREKRGLTYGIDTGIAPMDHGAMVIGNAAVDNAKVGQAWNVALDTLRLFYKEGATDKEITMTKDFLTGEAPLAMTSTDKIADVLNGLQQDKLPSDFLDKRSDLIRAVTNEDVKRAIHDWFNPDHLTLSMVGKPEGITPTATRDLIRD